MTPSRSRRPSPALVIASLALFVAMGGVGVAQDAVNSAVKKITGKQIAKKAIAKKHLKAGAVTSPKVRNGTLLAEDFDPSTFAGLKGATGATGAKGDTGATGAKGDKGDKGDPGDPATADGPALAMANMSNDGGTDCLYGPIMGTSVTTTCNSSNISSVGTVLAVARTVQNFRAQLNSPAASNKTVYIYALGAPHTTCSIPSGGTVCTVAVGNTYPAGTRLAIEVDSTTATSNILTTFELVNPTAVASTALRSTASRATTDSER